MHQRFAARACVSAAVLATITANAALALPAFPGAEGFGGAFTGTAPVGGWFSNASVYHVTTTADLFDANDKPVQGTLRGAFYDYTNPSSPKQTVKNRVVVFDVGGIFNITAATLDIKSVNNIYIAGQTAPTPVTVYGNTTQITHSNSATANTSNVVLRYMTFRRGSEVAGNADAITIGGGGAAGIASNMILDHVSSSWSTDENLSVTNYNTNVTVQYSIIADSLRSNHAYGSLIRPMTNSSVTLHHNLYANNASRQARFGTYNEALLTADFRNNVIYNWRDRASYTGGSSEAEQEFSNVNYVGNYLVAGPGTVGAANMAFSVDKNVTSQVYQNGNFVDADKAVNPGGVPNGSDLGWAAFQVSNPVTDQSLTQMASPFATASVTTQTALAAYNQVTNYVGNFWWNREAIDSRIIGNVLNGTNPAGGVAADNPNAAELAALLATPTVARAAGYDTDNDGIPNAWEATVGSNPSVGNSGADFDNDGYTDLEEYLNDAGAFPAPTPITFVGGSARFALSANWNLDWQPSRYDVARINSGTATVDAVGQKAGIVSVGDTSGANGTLAITSGWIQISNSLEVGAAGTGLVNQTGGVVTAGTGVMLGGIAGASGTYTLTGGTLAAASITPGANGATLNLNGGTLSPLISNTNFMPAGVNAKVQAGGAKIDTAGVNIAIASPLVHDAALGATADGGLLKSGAGTLTLNGVNTFTGLTTVAGGKLLLSQGVRNNNAVTLSAGTTIEISPRGDAAGVSRIKSLSLPTSGSNFTAAFELHDNDLIVDYTGNANAYSTVLNMVKKGLTAFGGNGLGITSAEINANALPGTTLAVIDNQNQISSLSGFTIPNPGTSVLVKYTWTGDANLDGVVDGTDYALTDSGFAGGGITWNQGDYNYSGGVDGTDYALIDTGFGSQTGALPEPGMIGLVGLGMIFAARRTRRA